MKHRMLNNIDILKLTKISQQKNNNAQFACFGDWRNEAPQEALATAGSPETGKLGLLELYTALKKV